MVDLGPLPAPPPVLDERHHEVWLSAYCAVLSSSADAVHGFGEDRALAKAARMADAAVEAYRERFPPELNPNEGPYR